MTMLFNSIIFLLLSVGLCADEFQIISAQLAPSWGMFATANRILGHLYLYEEREPPEIVGLSVDFGTSGLYYDPKYGPNWWSYYFEPISVGQQGNDPITFPTSRQCGLANDARQLRLTHAKAASLVEKYVRVKRPIVEIVDQFVRRNFQGLFTIGMHYRGTDKTSEAPRVPYEVVFETIRKQIPLNQPYNIFVATDEAAFLEKMNEEFPGRVIAAEAYRSLDATGVHYSKSSGYEKGKEALIDALLLSRCDLLIRTSSNLSLWSTYFNPELPVILLNRRCRPSLEPE